MSEVQAAGDLVVPWVVVVAGIGLLASLVRSYLQDRNGRGVRAILREQLAQQSDSHDAVLAVARATQSVAEELHRHDKDAREFHHHTGEAVGEIKEAQAVLNTKVDVVLNRRPG